jgi:salicylate synthetase
MSTSRWREWAEAIPALTHRRQLHAPHDPAAAAVLLASASPGEQYALYERDGVWHVAVGASATLSADTRHTTARAAGHSWVAPSAGQLLDHVAEALAELGRTPAGGRHAYGWATFELGHLLHGNPAAAGSQPLIHLMLPSADITLSSGRALILAADDTRASRIAALLGNTLTAAPLGGRRLPDIDSLLRTSGAEYQQDVTATIADIRAGRIDKAVLSRAVALPQGTTLDLAASYLAGRKANTPARSFLLDLGGWQAAGFSPETMVEVDTKGRVTTQPLAGTRALGPDPAQNQRLRTELLNDPKEVHEHAISVRLAFSQLAAICQPDTVAIEQFMTVSERGSVQHLASQVAGQLESGRGPWPAFAALFPAITATGVPTKAALATLAEREREPRGLYGGTVFLAHTHGSLDAALVLRTVFHRDGCTWLRAGAGVMGQSTPDREYEETCEKLRSVAPYLRLTSTTR